MAQETEMAQMVKTEAEVMSTKLCLGITQFSSFPAVVREIVFGAVAFDFFLKNQDEPIIKEILYYGVSPQSVNITGFVHNIHKVSL